MEYLPKLCLLSYLRPIHQIYLILPMCLNLPMWFSPHLSPVPWHLNLYSLLPLSTLRSVPLWFRAAYSVLYQLLSSFLRSICRQLSEELSLPAPYSSIPESVFFFVPVFSFPAALPVSALLIAALQIPLYQNPAILSPPLS